MNKNGITSANKKEVSKVAEETYRSVREYVIEAQERIYKSVNCAMVEAYWRIGEKIYEACGQKERAAYGENVLKEISDRLTREFGKGFDVSNLRRMRKLFLCFRNRDTLCPELSWSHYRLLMRINNERKRAFYTQETVKSGWSVRQLERQINTMYYDRLVISRDKENMKKEIETVEPKLEYEQIIKDPYVLEFLNLPANEHFYESELEQALIDHLQKFLLELGRGFSFVARQKRFNLEGNDFFIDLVFYNYMAKCFVLVDLKTGKITHQDIGQMQMYVNYYTRELMSEGDNPPIGILLCADKNDAVVQYTLPLDNQQIYAAKYLPYMPTENELKRELNLEDFKRLEKDD